MALFEQLLDVADDEQSTWLELRTAGRPELRDRLLSMLRAHHQEVLKTGSALDALVEEPPPERIGAYRIDRLIGHGGMGSVYRGERAQGDFEHVVAIKIIKPGLLSEPLVARFQRERQTLAGLTHPNIAQLYDGGATEGGSPFIVMEFVDGAPLLRWADEHHASRAERQRLFLDIGAAVAFAHRNLVVHRDLTPSNVLVTREGAVKLIDFGIARPVDLEPAGADPDAVPSLAGLSLTPGYAAPERMISANVTTAADVFSLGRLFAELINPSRRERDPLAIIARATAQRPLDRYSTVDAMLADVRAWRDGFPVEARNGGAVYVARRFVSRRPIAVGAAAGGLVLLLAALGATLVANVHAERARVEAERRFQQTREIAKTMIFDAYGEVSRVPGSTKARAVLAEAGLKYLDALASDPKAPLDVKVEAGRGYVRLAEAVGGGQSSQLGKLADSDALLVKAEGLLRPAHAMAPKDPEATTALAELLIAQSGSNLYNTNDVKLARKEALEAQNLLADIATTAPDRARYFATAIQAEGDSHAWEENWALARDAHLRAERFLVSLPVEMQQEAGLMRARSANLRLLGDAYQSLDQETEAFEVTNKAVEINRQVLATQTDHPVFRRSLAVSLYTRAMMERKRGLTAAADRSIGEAVTLARSLRQRDPESAGALNLFAIVAEVQAQVFADLGRYAESLALGEEVLSAHRQAIALAKDMAGPKRTLATALITHGENALKGGAQGRACASWREAVELFEGIDRQGELTPYDKNGGLKSARDHLAKSCG